MKTLVDVKTMRSFVFTGRILGLLGCFVALQCLLLNKASVDGLTIRFGRTPDSSQRRNPEAGRPGSSSTSSSDDESGQTGSTEPGAMGDESKAQATLPSKAQDIYTVVEKGILGNKGQKLMSRFRSRASETLRDMLGGIHINAQELRMRSNSDPLPRPIVIKLRGGHSGEKAQTPSASGKHRASRQLSNLEGNGPRHGPGFRPPPLPSSRHSWAGSPDLKDFLNLPPPPPPSPGEMWNASSARADLPLPPPPTAEELANLTGGYPRSSKRPAPQPPRPGAIPKKHEHSFFGPETSTPQSDSVQTSPVSIPPPPPPRERRGLAFQAPFNDSSSSSPSPSSPSPTRPPPPPPPPPSSRERRGLDFQAPFNDSSSSSISPSSPSSSSSPSPTRPPPPPPPPPRERGGRDRKAIDTPISSKSTSVDPNAGAGGSSQQSGRATQSSSPLYPTRKTKSRGSSKTGGKGPAPQPPSSGAIPKRKDAPIQRSRKQTTATQSDSVQTSPVSIPPPPPLPVPPPAPPLPSSLPSSMSNDSLSSPTVPSLPARSDRSPTPPTATSPSLADQVAQKAKDMQAKRELEGRGIGTQASLRLKHAASPQPSSMQRSLEQAILGRRKQMEESEDEGAESDWDE